MMWRINALLLLVLVACALSLVSSQQRARRLFVELEAAQKHTSDLNTEWEQLLIEQGTWSNHGRIEQIARKRLNMQDPAPGQVMVVEGVQ